jgi:hypothetical protein
MLLVFSAWKTGKSMFFENWKEYVLGKLERACSSEKVPS